MLLFLPSKYRSYWTESFCRNYWTESKNICFLYCKLLRMANSLLMFPARYLRLTPSVGSEMPKCIGKLHAIWNKSVRSLHERSLLDINTRDNSYCQVLVFEWIYRENYRWETLCCVAMLQIAWWWTWFWHGNTFWTFCWFFLCHWLKCHGKYLLKLCLSMERHK